MTQANLDLAYALDPALFFEAAGLDEPLPWQESALRSDADSQIYVCARQAGKSTTAGAKSVHRALYSPGSLTLMVSRTQDHSGELFRKAISIYNNLGRPVEAESQTALSLTLENGSR